jgi:hypothetical protein
MMEGLRPFGTLPYPGADKEGDNTHFYALLPGSRQERNIYKDYTSHFLSCQAWQLIDSYFF